MYKQRTYKEFQKEWRRVLWQIDDNYEAAATTAIALASRNIHNLVETGCVSGDVSEHSDAQPAQEQCGDAQDGAVQDESQSDNHHSAVEFHDGNMDHNELEVVHSGIGDAYHHSGAQSAQELCGVHGGAVQDGAQGEGLVQSDNDGDLQSEDEEEVVNNVSAVSRRSKPVRTVMNLLSISVETERAIFIGGAVNATLIHYGF